MRDMRLKNKSDYSNNWFNKFIYTSMDFIGEIHYLMKLL